MSGHNAKGVKRTPEQKATLSRALSVAWQTTRSRLPIGSTTKNRSGYITEKVVAGKGPWALQHVLVMERVIGRRIRKGEEVHHINGQRDDNRPENLFLCKSKSEHNKIERTLVSTCRELLASGVVVFNREKAVYQIA